MKNKQLKIVTCRLAGGGHGPERVPPPARSRPDVASKTKNRFGPKSPVTRV